MDPCFKMKTRFLIIIGIVSVMSIVVGLSIASPSINNFDDFVYQLNEPFDGAELEQIAQPESEPSISGKMAQEICSITGGECPLNYPVNIQEDGSKMVIVTIWDADTKTEKQFVFFIKNKTLSYEERVNGKLVTESEQTKIINNIPLTIPSAQEFLNMDCEDLNHLYPEFSSKEVTDAWITRMHECLNEQENTKQELEDFCAWSFPKIEHEVYYADCMKGHLVGVNQWIQNQEN